MKESIGYTVSLNIMIVFITIIVAFLCAALIYYKSNKVSNVITSGIEKYEGYDDVAIEEIGRKLTSIGYGSKAIYCDAEVVDNGAFNSVGQHKCDLIQKENSQGERGYCVYVCYEENKFATKAGKKVYTGEYYYYKIRTNMMVDVPLVDDVLNIPIYSNTNRLYNFDSNVIE